MTRLEAISRAMREAFGAANEAQRRTAMVEACERAVVATELGEPVVATALEALREGAASDGEPARRLLELSEAHDGRYFDLEEREGASDESHLLFRKARAAAALASALEDDIAEALYEAIYATDDVDAAVVLVIDALRA